MKGTTVLRNVFDERMFDQLRAGSRAGRSVVQLGDYVREARRCRWAWSLICDALRCSEGTARRWAEAARKAQVTR